MTSSNETNPNPAADAREIGTDNLDQVVGGASTVVVHQARKQEQSDKVSEEAAKAS